jgi:hypothetical protein
LRRGNVAYIALVGDAAGLAWRSGRLSGQRAPARSGRPLGLESEPRITLWSTPIRPGDRLILLCGAAWHDSTAEDIHDILANNPTPIAEQRLVDALTGPHGLARALVDDGTRPGADRGHRASSVVQPRHLQSPRPRPWRWLLSLVPTAALSLAASMIVNPGGHPQDELLRQQAEALLTEAQAAGDLYQAHDLVSGALSAAQRAADLSPREHNDVLVRAAQALEDVDRVGRVQPWLVVRLGPTGSNVVDLAVGNDRLFTLDVFEGAVRGFDPAGVEQWPTGETLLVRKGAPVGTRFLDTPVAIQFLPAGRAGGPGALTVVDRARTVALLTPEGQLSARSLPGSASWQRLGALGADGDGNLYVLDSGAPVLLEYRATTAKFVEPPSPVPSLNLDRAAEIVPLQDIYLRLEDGRVRRLTRDGRELSFDVRTPDGRLGPIAALAPDRMGGLYLADPSNARVLHVSADGSFVRQLRDPALGGVRQIQSSLDGQRLFGLVATGVVAFDIPSQ